MTEWPALFPRRRRWLSGLARWPTAALVRGRRSEYRTPEATPILKTKRDANGHSICSRCENPIRPSQHIVRREDSMVHVECLSKM
jgi:hypothetical protein